LESSWNEGFCQTRNKKRILWNHRATEMMIIFWRTFNVQSTNSFSLVLRSAYNFVLFILANRTNDIVIFFVIFNYKKIVIVNTVSNNICFYKLVWTHNTQYENISVVNR
jgi:hypothetical protein